MDNFKFFNPTRVIFGKESVKSLTMLLNKSGAKKVLLHYGGGSIKQNGVYDDCIKALSEANIPYTELSGVKPNPRLTLVKRGIEIVKNEGIDFILAVGGGSVIDSAKAIGVGALFCGDFWQELFMQGNPAKKMLPLGVVLTLAATGSESSTSCVITGEDGFKRGIGGEALLPTFSILDPTYTKSLPSEQTAYGACDIFAHLLERYFTPSVDVELTDNMIEAVMKTVIKYAPIALKNPNDYNARAQLMWSGTVAHNNSLNAGRLGDWASHKIEHELSGRYDIPHGLGLAIIFPAWMKYVYKKDEERFKRFAINVFGCDPSYKNLVGKGIECFEKWLKSLGLATRLSEIGIGDDDFSLMAKMCLEGREYVGEFVKLYANDVEAIYNLSK